jgi:hypothetical protein
MAWDLIRKVRNCPPEERQAAALELARTGGEDGFAELIRMVEGRRRRWLSRYKLSDQLAATTALAVTGRKEALEYLERLYTPVEGRPVALESQRTGLEEGVHFLTTRESSRVDYPDAYGELRERLGYEVQIRYAVDAQRLGLVERRKVRQTDNRDRTVHETVNAAIAALTRKLGTTRPH